MPKVTQHILVECLLVWAALKRANNHHPANDCYLTPSIKELPLPAVIPGAALCNYAARQTHSPAQGGLILYLQAHVSVWDEVDLD